MSETIALNQPGQTRKLALAPIDSDNPGVGLSLDQSTITSRGVIGIANGGH